MSVRTEQRANRLTAELEAATLLQIRRTFFDLNQSLFKGKLRQPVLSLSDDAATLGKWRSEYRTLELSRRLLTEHGWGVVVEVLKHEMAHQFVDEVLEGSGVRPHGELFQQVCERRAIDPGAGGVPRKVDASSAEGRVLDRIAKLLALAQSNNRHEAEAATSAAQRLMLKHNIETALAPEPARYSFRHLGSPSGRIDASQRLLSVILDEFFFVEAIWVPVWRPLENKRGSVLEICGTVDNLETAEYVHLYLNRTAEQLWKEHKRSRGIRRDANRRAFLAGVMNGFLTKLSNQRRAQEREGLVWCGDEALHDYFRRRHPHVRRSSTGGRHDRESYRAGCEAGSRIVLRRGVGAGPSGAPKLLRGA